MKRVLLLLTLLLILAKPVQADGPGTVEWSVVAAGGGAMDDGVYHLGATVGQGAVGVAEDGLYTLQAGFWHTRPSASSPQYWLYLPLIVRND